MASRLVYPFLRFFAQFRTRLPLRRHSSCLIFHPHSLALGRARRTASTLSRSLALSSLPCDYLSHRVYLSLDPDSRPGRAKWHPAGQIHHGKSSPAGHRCEHRHRTIPLVPNPLLVQRQRSLFANPMRSRRFFGDAAPRRDRARSMSFPSLADLLVSLNHLSRIPRLSMGHPASGNGFSGDVLCPSHFAPAHLSNRPTFADRPVAPALAFVLSHVPIWLRQTAQRRSNLAQSHRTYFPLRNSTTANLDRMVRPSTSRLVPKDIHSRDVRHRISRSLSHFCSTPSEVYGMRSSYCTSNFYPAHW